MDKVITGDRLEIPAGTWNNIIDATRAHQAGALSTVTPTVDDARDFGVILCRNSTGADLLRFKAVGLSSPPISPWTNGAQFARRVLLEAILPTAASFQRFAISLEPVKNNAVGRFLVSGCIQAPLWLDDADAAALGRADIEAGALDYLKPHAEGAAQILWQDSAMSYPSMVWAVVRLSTPPPAPAVSTWQAYMNGDQTIAATEADDQTLEFDAVDLANDLFSLSSNELTISETGRFDVTLNLHVKSDDTASWTEPRNAQAWLEVGSGSTWDQVAGSLWHAYANYQRETKTSITFVLDHADTDKKYRVRGTRFNELPGGNDPEGAIWQGGDQTGESTAPDGCFMRWLKTGEATAAT